MSRGGMTALFARLSKAARLIGSALRVAGCRLRLGSGAIPASTRMERHASISASDGGRVRLGEGTALAANATLVARHGTLEIGANGFVGIGTVIVARDAIRIGRDALIAEYVTIRDQDHRFGGERPTALSGFETAPITIGDNVWIGAKATVTRGVTIGDNSVIGANSVVTRDIPANVVAAGIPARVIRAIGPEDRQGLKTA